MSFIFGGGGSSAPASGGHKGQLLKEKHLELRHENFRYTMKLQEVIINLLSLPAVQVAPLIR